MAVRRRGGALARKSSSLRSTAEAACSITAGTSDAPARSPSAKRLKPSTISKDPSSSGTARTGISASTGAACAGGLVVERKPASRVCSRSTASHCTSGGGVDSLDTDAASSGAGTVGEDAQALALLVDLVTDSDLEAHADERPEMGRLSRLRMQAAGPAQREQPALGDGQRTRVGAGEDEVLADAIPGGVHVEHLVDDLDGGVATLRRALPHGADQGAIVALVRDERVDLGVVEVDDWVGHRASLLVRPLRWPSWGLRPVRAGELARGGPREHARAQQDDRSSCAVAILRTVHVSPAGRSSAAAGVSLRGSGAVVCPRILWESGGERRRGANPSGAGSPSSRSGQSPRSRSSTCSVRSRSRSELNRGSRPRRSGIRLTRISSAARTGLDSGGAATTAPLRADRCRPGA